MSDRREQRTRRLVPKLALVAVAMFAFGVWAMPPLYDRFCEVLGIGEAGVRTAEAVPTDLEAIDRQVRLRFNATTNSALPWVFEPGQNAMDVRLGEPSEALYLAMNTQARPTYGRAVYNVSPPEASLYFVKTECFCFTEQVLAANETREMPVYFYVQPDLPAHIEEITLSYTFFPLPGPQLADNDAAPQAE